MKTSEFGAYGLIKNLNWINLQLKGGSNFKEPLQIEWILFIYFFHPLCS